MSTLTVGAGGAYATLGAAVAASRDGDVLAVRAGTYVNDFATISTRITIEGVGGMVNLVATEAPPDGKAILTTNTDVTIRGLSFSGAQVPDGNGAGIRHQGGALVVEDSLFRDNENGILSGAIEGGTITIRRSEFDGNGAGDGYTHNLYAGDIARLTVEDSWFHDADTGHQIKSRALETTITGSRITDGATGTGSYSVDLPIGGRATIAGNVIEQGPRSGNPAIVHFGGEGGPHPGSSLVITGNTVVNELDSPSAALLLNETSVVAEIRGGATFGLGPDGIARGAAEVSGVATLASRPASDLSHPYAGDAGTPPTEEPPVEEPPTGEPPADGNLVVHVSQDAWRGDAEYVVSVDGRQVGGVRTASASHAAGESEAVRLPGTFAAGEHEVAVTFLNDAWGGTAATDRNLYLDGVTFEGRYEAVNAVLERPGRAAATVGETTEEAPRDGTHSLTLRLSEDAWQGDARFTVSVDGERVGAGTVTASHGAGEAQSFTFDGLSASEGRVEVAFLNDAWGGTMDTDRNLYVEAIAVDGVDQGIAPATLLWEATAAYDVGPWG